jgi:hypothetical protein
MRPRNKNLAAQISGGGGGGDGGGGVLGCGDEERLGRVVTTAEVTSEAEMSISYNGRCE